MPDAVNICKLIYIDINIYTYKVNFSCYSPQCFSFNFKKKKKLPDVKKFIHENHCCNRFYLFRRTSIHSSEWVWLTRKRD